MTPVGLVVLAQGAAVALTLAMLVLGGTITVRDWPSLMATVAPWLVLGVVALLGGRLGAWLARWRQRRRLKANWRRLFGDGKPGFRPGRR
jgi:uncharacterized membrane protein YfcA